MKRIVILVSKSEKEKIEIHGVLEDVDYKILHTQDEGTISTEKLANIIAKNLKLVNEGDSVMELLVDDNLYTVEDVDANLESTNKDVTLNVTWTVPTFEHAFIKADPEFDKNLLSKTVEDLNEFAIEEGFLSIDFELSK